MFVFLINVNDSLLPFGDISNQTKKRYTSYSYVLRMRELIDGYLNHIYIFFHLSSLPCSNISHPGTTQLRKAQSISQRLASSLFLCKQRNTAKTINILHATCYKAFFSLNIGISREIEQADNRRFKNKMFALNQICTK